MKLASIAFFGLLIYAHQASVIEQPIGRPLCDFRDGDAFLGYALFSMIALVGILYTISVKRFEKVDDTLSTVGFGALLLIIVATPSWWSLHAASVIVLLSSVYLYFAVLLFRGGRMWLWALHLSVPLVLGVATGFHHYGIWQKMMICYFVVAAVIHEDVLRRAALPNYAVTNEPAM